MSSVGHVRQLGALVGMPPMGLGRCVCAGTSIQPPIVIQVSHFNCLLSLALGCLISSLVSSKKC